MTVQDTARPRREQIRSTHRYAFRSGKWADLLTTAPSPDGRDCYIVRFADGVTDYWDVNDPDGRYEFRSVSAVTVQDTRTCIHNFGDPLCPRECVKCGKVEDPRYDFDPRDLSVRPAHPHEIGWMLHEHYLGKWPGVATAIVALCRLDVPVGCIVFAEAPRETSRRYGGHTWELARLWVKDEEPRNTESWFIARAVKLVRRLCPSIRFLVSYADPSVGHEGTIYRASNWRYDGHTDSERKTPRFDYLCDGKRYSRRAHLPPGQPFERVPRTSKARFVLEVGA